MTRRKIMSKNIEKPFEYLRRKDGSQFSSDVIKNWYKARAFVLDRLKDVAFKDNDGHHLHVVLKGDSDLMLSVARQVALSAHYLNYDEERKGNRTVITIVSNSTQIEKTLQKEEYLYNLLFHCKWTHGKITHTPDSYIDIEINIVSSCDETESEYVKVIEEAEVISFCNSKLEDEIYSIDTRKAVYAGRMYNLGMLIENLPAENIHDANRYALALDVFQFERLQEPLDPLINDSKWKSDQIRVKNGLSNVFCADCFETRATSVELYREDKKQTDAMLWAKYNEALSKSEHARWAVEKLIMGFRPLNEEERLDDEKLAAHKKKRKEYRNNLKKNSSKLAHIDLCSYSDLRRVNPDDMKYDSFLMLAIPNILAKVIQK